MKIDWSKKSKKRMHEIRVYYETKSLKVSKEILTDITDSAKALTKFPQMAQIEPLLSDLPISFRSLVVRGIYKIIYYVDERKEVINIVTVWDCRQDDKKLKEEVV
jgi:plasmid stabilization system protein ParE